MEKAIQIATASGYYTTFFDKDSDVLIDPLFWQALGKGLGWEPEEWKWQAKWFMEHLMEGKDIQSFFIAL